ncbi:MAG: hypothetical protein WEB58_11760 [Planctomycetaceae bacterium]
MFGLGNQIWLLAADVSTVITILVMLLYGISWVVQKIAENKNAPPPKGRPARQLPAPQAKELDDFLKRARKGNQAGRQNDDVMFEKDLLEVVEDEPQRRPRPIQAQTPREPRRQKPKARPKPQPLAPPPTAQLNVDEPVFARSTVNRPMQSEMNSSFGQSQLNALQQHLTAYMETGRVDKSVAEHLPSLFKELKNELRSRTDSSSAAANADDSMLPLEEVNAARSSIIEMFHDPQQVRRAIIINEILQRPRSLRHE